MFKLNKVKSNNVVRKDFSYEKDGINLRFSLRIDEKKELKTFLELLEVAQKEVIAEINK